MFVLEVNHESILLFQDCQQYFPHQQLFISFRQEYPSNFTIMTIVYVQLLSKRKWMAILADCDSMFVVLPRILFLHSKTLPSLQAKEKFTDMAFYVPIPDTFFEDLFYSLKKLPKYFYVNRMEKETLDGPLRDSKGYTEMTLSPVN